MHQEYQGLCKARAEEKKGNCEKRETFTGTPVTMSPSRENVELLHPGEAAANEQLPAEEGCRNEEGPGDREDKTVSSGELKMTILRVGQMSRKKIRSLHQKQIRSRSKELSKVLSVVLRCLAEHP